MKNICQTMPIEHRSIWQTRTPVMNRGVRQAGIEQTQSVASNECQKKCGSRSCKTAIKFTPNGASNPEEKKCPGVGTGCTSCRTKLANDMQEADRWLLTFDGNRDWLNNHGRKVSKCHLSVTAFQLP